MDELYYINSKDCRERSIYGGNQIFDLVFDFIVKFERYDRQSGKLGGQSLYNGPPLVERSDEEDEDDEDNEDNEDNGPPLVERSDENDENDDEDIKLYISPDIRVFKGYISNYHKSEVELF